MSQSNIVVPVFPAFAVRQELRSQRGLPFAEYLPASLIHALGRQFGLVFRNRVFTPAVTLWTFLSQVLDHDHSCRQAVARRLVLITTLTDAAAVSGASLADLYRRRWQVELHLRSLKQMLQMDIKQMLQMDILRGRSPAMVRKEVWAHLLVYNLVRVVMAQAAVADSLRPDEISFTGALQNHQRLS